jgi:hypothetical protein
MIYRLLLSGAMLLACGVYATSIDSSGIIFNDSRIHAYELRFYYADWEDSLKYYKNLPDEEYIPARFVYRRGPGDSIVLDSIGVRYKGNSSYNFATSSPKKPFKFSFDKYRAGRTFFGVKKLNFSNGAKDPTMMREKIAYDIIGEYTPAPRTAFATISIEGRLIGLYTQIEQVDKIFLSRHFLKNDYNLYKSNDNGSTLLYKGVNQSIYEADYDLKTNETVNDWAALIGMIDKLNNTQAADFTRIVGGCLALDNICRYLAFNMVLSNFDSYTGSGRNFYFYDDSMSRKFTLIPWDLNLSFGVYGNNWNVTTVDVVTISNLAQRPLNKRIMENDSLRRVYLLYIQAMIDGFASSDSISAKAVRLNTLIDSLARVDSNKLHTYDDFSKNQDTDVVVLDGISRTTIPGLKSFSQKRNAALRTQLANYLPVRNPGRSVGRINALLLASQPGRERDVVIRYRIRSDNTDANLSAFNGRGVRVAGLSMRNATAGEYRYSWNTRTVPKGWYFIRLTENGSLSAVRGIAIIP